MLILRHDHILIFLTIMSRLFSLLATKNVSFYLILRHDHILIFLTIMSRLFSLLATKNVSFYSIDAFTRQINIIQHKPEAAKYCFISTPPALPEPSIHIF